jgi:HAE1 family hydrophobic/amphiphilic exporter-1
MWLSDLAIRKPMFVTVFVLAATIVGAISYANTPVDLYPDFEIPIVAVRTVYPGASPDEVERAVTRPLEDAVAAVSGVDTMTSQSTDSVSNLTIQFVESRNSKDAAADVTARINAIRSTLPSDIQDPLVYRYDFAALPIVSFAIADSSGGRTPLELRAFVDNTIRPRLERLAGVGGVSLTGGRVREIDVALRLDRLRAIGVSATTVVAAIKGENTNIPGGRVITSLGEAHVRTTGEFQSLAQIGDVAIPTANGSSVRLRDVADISEGAAEARQISRLDGVESVVVSAQKQPGTNSIAVANRLKAEMEQLKTTYPELRIVPSFDTSSFVQEMLSDVQLSLILGAILAALVVLFFFRDIRNTLVTVAGLPVIVLSSFIILRLLGITLNEISMLALSLCIGLLVDDAIVVRENIFRRIERGEDPASAAQHGTAEIALAVVAVSSTIVAVFLPIGFVGGQVGKFMRDFGVTVSVAVIVSLIEAFTLAPMLSAHLFHRTSPSTTAAQALVRRSRLGWLRLPRFSDAGYRRVLGLALRHRKLTVGIGAGLFVGSLLLTPLLPTAFLADSDYGFIVVTLELPPGTSLAETDRVNAAMEDVFRGYPQIDHYVSTVGGGEPFAGVEAAVERSTTNVIMKKRGETKRVLADLRPKLIAAAGPSAHVTTDLNSGGGSGVRARPILISVKGDDPEGIDAASAVLVERIAKIPGAIDVERTLRRGKPATDVSIDRSRTADLGVSAAQVGLTVRTLLNGEAATSYRVGEHTYDIVVQLRPQDRVDPSAVLRLPITTARGTQVPLSAVARLAPVEEPVEIDRTDRQREILVGAGALGRDVSAVSADVRKVMDELRATVPPGVRIENAGDLQRQSDSFASLFNALGLSILCIYVLLALQFGNFVHPFTIMVALPLSIVGALVALLLARQTFDIVAMIGVILLMGLVTKNSILLVDFANRRMRLGATAREAMLEAGPTRLRPILMTTGAMVLGMLPVATGFGTGSEFRQPMGTAVIGGLIASTMLTLIVVPVIYTWMDGLTRFVKRIFTRAPRQSAPVLGSDVS